MILPILLDGDMISRFARTLEISFAPVARGLSFDVSGLELSHPIADNYFRCRQTGELVMDLVN